MSTMEEDLGPTANYPSEAAKHLRMILPFLSGNIVDVGSGGWPVVKQAIQVELTSEEFNHYTSGRAPEFPIQWHGTGRDLPFRDGVVDTVFSSHLLEDFPLEEWPGLLGEWARVLRPGGKLVILTPDRERWRKALEGGQTPNCCHRHEPVFGEVSGACRAIGLTVLVERFCDERDYSVITVCEKT